ncbi:MAG TPA: 4-alpha-glucanotransferase [Steroidobacteraceae bacterium]|nr:4-alpha-glucanotransferase [Steroidobacteraceae bacterium]
MRLSVFDRRRAGVLLHLGCLDAALGQGGRAFIDWLAEAGFSLWQILPLGPTGADGSPYWVRSDFAGHYAFVDPSELPDPHSALFESFLQATTAWLPDYALYEALSSVQHGKPWWQWPTQLRNREPQAMAQARRELDAPIRRIQLEQFAFSVQWHRLREHAQSRGVRLLGDLPFYVAPDSAETWVHRRQFQLDAAGQPLAVAGVPPDYFSETGQLWGNPLYDWDAIRQDDFALWRARVAGQLERVDALRIDHFRALAAHWAVPAAAADARGGAWKPTPGRELMRLLHAELGDLPIVAEDLGVITPDVEALRRDFRLPGMRVLQFAFGGDADSPHLPYMHEPDSVVYTGTHDNDTTLGWYATLDGESLRRVELFLRLTPGAMPAAMIRAALGSVGRLAVIPLQDVLRLGSEARLNTPGTAQGNWTWRLPPGTLTPQLATQYRLLNGMYGRA